MDPIIRYAPASPFARRVGRPSAPTASAPVTPAASVAPARSGAAGVYQASPVAPVAPVAASAPPTERDYAAELARAGSEHAAALQQRDAEIAGLRGAADKAQQLLGDAHDVAQRRGFTAGEKKGEQAGYAALQAQVDRAIQIADQIRDARADLVEQGEEAMIVIVFAAVCRIVGEQGTTRDTIGTVVREAVAATRTREHLTLRLHPDDAALFKARAQAGEGALRIAADPSIALGGCMVDSAIGTLDARFETQLGLLGAAMTAARARRLADEAGA